MTNNELYHHGILGMKWGVRRYQNPDGSYTAAGRKRYDIGPAEKATRSFKGNMHRVAAKVYDINAKAYKKSNKALSSMNAAERTKQLKLAEAADKAKYEEAVARNKSKQDRKTEKAIKRTQKAIKSEKKDVDSYKKNYDELTRRFGKANIDAQIAGIQTVSVAQIYSKGVDKTDYGKRELNRIFDDMNSYGYKVSVDEDSHHITLIDPNGDSAGVMRYWTAG